MLVGYVLTKVSVTVYAGGVMLQGLMGLDFSTGAAAVVVLTGVYTAAGAACARRWWGESCSTCGNPSTIRSSPGSAWC